MKQISSALVKAQSEMSNPVKGNTNPFFRSKYADLNAVREAILPVLNQHGIVVLQPIIHDNGKNFVKTVLLHESGESIESLTEILYSKPNDAQAQGSGISYARRYGLQSFVCVGADDDDGQSAVKPPKKEEPVHSTQITAKQKSYAEQLLICSTLSELANVWKSIPKGKEQDELFELKEELKTKLNGKV